MVQKSASPQHSTSLHNAKYHSVEINKAPISSNQKQDMIDWLQTRGINHDPSAVKPVIYSVVLQHKDNYRQFKIDSLASDHGHTVLRLPPYHCNFNPIELIWGRAKNYVAKRNITFMNADVHALFLEAINKVRAEDWSSACEHVKKEEQFYREKEGIIDEVMDRFIINLEESDDEKMAKTMEVVRLRKLRQTSMTEFQFSRQIHRS